jgi:hypothetical protein
MREFSSEIAPILAFPRYRRGRDMSSLQSECLYPNRCRTAVGWVRIHSTLPIPSPAIAGRLLLRSRALAASAHPAGGAKSEHDVIRGYRSNVRMSDHRPPTTDHRPQPTDYVIAR